jgi:hypothetical protein
VISGRPITVAEALDPGDSVGEIEDGRNSKNPLYVDYPNDLESPAKRARLAEVVSLTAQLVPVPCREAATLVVKVCWLRALHFVFV